MMKWRSNLVFAFVGALLIKIWQMILERKYWWDGSRIWQLQAKSFLSNLTSFRQLTIFTVLLQIALMRLNLQLNQFLSKDFSVIKWQTPIQDKQREKYLSKDLLSIHKASWVSTKDLSTSQKNSKNIEKQTCLLRNNCWRNLQPSRLTWKTKLNYKLFQCLKTKWIILNL